VGDDSDGGARNGDQCYGPIDVVLRRSSRNEGATGILGLMGEIVDADEVATWAVWVSPVFGDIVAKMTVAVNLEVERRLRLGLPVVVDRGNGIEDLPA
jgi:hypothetical protein